MNKTKPEPEQIPVDTVEQWHAWLAEHHARPNGVWLVSWKKHTGKPRMTYDDAVEEALCWGWVDSRSGRIDDDRERLWFSPRRQGSNWSRSNKHRIARLEAQGRLTEVARTLVHQAKADGSWTRLDDVEDLIVPDDLAKAFENHPGAIDRWESFPRGVRRSILEWIVTAKRDETRRKRITETAELAQRGERVNQ